MNNFKKELNFIRRVTIAQYACYGILFIGGGIFYGHANGGWWQAFETAVVLFAIVSAVMYLTYERAKQRLKQFGGWQQE